MVVWIIGLAGAGKTTIGKLVYEKMNQNNPATVFLDGDHVREIMGEDIGHSIEDRNINAWRICHMCHYLEKQGIDVVCSILSMFPEHQEWNRATYSNYFEVYIDVDIDILIRRDQKSLYSSSISGEIKNVVGMDIPFVPPGSPHLVINNNEERTDFSDAVEQIIIALSSIENQAL